MGTLWELDPDLDFSNGQVLLTGSSSIIALTSTTIEATSDGPTVTANTGLDLDTNTSAPITFTMLHSADPDTEDADLVYQFDIGSPFPSNGQLLLDGAAITATDTFTQADINAGKLSYVHTLSLIHI